MLEANSVKACTQESSSAMNSSGQPQLPADWPEVLAEGQHNALSDALLSLAIYKLLESDATIQDASI